MNHRPFALAVLSICALLAALSGQIASSQGAGSRTVVLKSIAFSPEKLSITRGTKVTFAFRDTSTAHNVVSRGTRRFMSVGIRSSGSVSRTFRSTGTYAYSCTLHPGMSGRIVVR